MAGGTDLYPNMKRRQFEPKVSWACADWQVLRGHLANGGGLRLGALATLTEVADHPERPRALAGDRARRGLVSSPPLRNAGTIGGNLCVDTRCNYYNQSEFWRASVGYCMKKDGDVCLVAPGSPSAGPCRSSDTAPVMIALDAEVTLVGPHGDRRIPVKALYGSDGIALPLQEARGDPDRDPRARPHRLAHDVSQVPPTRARSIFRSSASPPRSSSAPAASVEDARIVLGAVHVGPSEATDAETFLRGRPLDRETIEMAAGLAYKPAKPLDNADLVYAWRKRMARIEVARALRELAGLPTGDLLPGPRLDSGLLGRIGSFPSRTAAAMR